MGRSRPASQRRRHHGAGNQRSNGALKKQKTKRGEFPEFEIDDEQQPPRRFSAGDIALGGRCDASHPAGEESRSSSRSPRRGGKRSPLRNEFPPWSSRNANRLRDDTPRQEGDDTIASETSPSPEPRPIDDSAPDERNALRHKVPEVPNEKGCSSDFFSPRTGRRRRRASWSSPRDSLRTSSSARDEAATSGDDGSPRAAKVPVALQLQWEMQGVSGRAYQKDGNLSLYRKKKMAARRRLAKHEGIRAAIERGWWPYLPLRWVVLNDKEVLKILPRHGYARLFSTMYATLVPTAEEGEAEETAKWEYGEDAKGLPLELGRAGIPLRAFSDALFAVADNWTETVMAKDYIQFLDLLWKRVRPDLLFPPPPLPEGKDPPPLFSTTMSKGESKTTQRGKRNRRRKAAADSSSPFPTTVRGVREDDALFGGESAPSSRFFDRPPPPCPAPPPRTPAGLLALNIPKFRPPEAHRAAWVRKGGLIDPEAEQVLRPAAELAGVGGGDVPGSGRGARPEQALDLGLKEAGEPGRKQGRWQQRLLATGLVDEREGSNGRPGVGRSRRKGATEEEEEEGEDMDSVWDFAVRNFSVDAREGDAFVLFLERKYPQLFDYREEAHRSHQGSQEIPHSARPDVNTGASGSGGGGGGGGCLGKKPRVVRSYRSKEDVWARSRRKNVPERVLKGLLATWRAGTGGMTPAEYGAAFIGAQRASFLAYAIANGWGTRAGGVHSQQTLDRVAEEWRLGKGHCSETEVLWEILEDIIWEVADKTVDNAFSDSVDLYSIPHRLLHDSPQAQAHAQSRIRGPKPSFRQHASQLRASTAPAAPTTRRAMPVTTRVRIRSSRLPRREEGGTATATADNGAAEGVGVRGRAVVAKDIGEKGPAAGPAGRVLLKGEKVAGSVRQGQVAYYQTACPTEKGACLEITLVSEGGAVGGGGRPPTPTAISLYAVQAQHRPLRLSLYTRASRGKTHHRLLLNWKGPSSSAGGHHAHPGPASAVASACANAVVCLPWEAEIGGHPRPPDPAGAPPAPIHIAVACPEPAPPSPPIAPAFDSGGIVLFSKEEEAGIAGAKRADGEPLRQDTGQGPVRRKRVKFSVAVAVVGPPRVVLEGRWHSLPFSWDVGTATNQHCPLAAYATVRLPAPLKISRHGWGPRRTPYLDGGDGEPSIGGGEEDEAEILDKQVLVTLQVRPSDPSECVDVYSGVCPRPGPKPADHAWWMVAGGTGSGDTGSGSGTGVPSEAVQIPSRPLTSEGSVSDTSEVVGSGATDNLFVGDASDALPPSDQLLGGGGSEAETKQGGGEENDGASAMGAERGLRSHLPGPHQVVTSEAGGSGWRRMTVALPRDHAGAFHIGVFRRKDRRKHSPNGTPREGKVGIKIAVWCPAVVIPPRAPLCGHLPRGQRRELLWTIGRDNHVFEARVEITRAIEDPLILRQLQFAHEFQTRFCATIKYNDRIPVSEAGRACQAMHVRPFLLASRRLSPTQNDYTWRGVNVEGTVEVLRSNDGVEQVYTRYTETLKVGPNDAQHETGRQRLAVDAGDSECWFRLFCWNRAASAEDTPSRAADARAVVSLPGDGAVRQSRPRFGGRENEGSLRPPVATARSEPAPTKLNHTPRSMQRGKGLRVDAHVRPGADNSLWPCSAVVPSSSGPGGVPQTSRSEGDATARPATRGAAIPSTMCTITGGVGATYVSPRSNLGGSARQLEVATQYLNHSLVVPTRPAQQNNNGVRLRPATAEPVRAGRRFLAEAGYNIGEFRPQTTPDGGQERSRNHTPLEGGDCRYRDMMHETSGMASRPLVSTRAALCTSGSPSSRSASTLPSPRGPVVVVPPKPEEQTSIERNASMFLLEEPPGARANPSCRSSRRQNETYRGFSTGANFIGEVGYTISSAGAAGGLSPKEKGKLEPQRTATVAAAVVPKLQLGRLPGSLGAKRT